MSQKNCWTIFLIRDTQVSRVWSFVHNFEFSLKTDGLAAWLLLSSAYEGGRFASQDILQEIHKLSTKTLWNMEERPI